VRDREAGDGTAYLGIQSNREQLRQSMPVI